MLLLLNPLSLPVFREVCLVSNSDMFVSSFFPRGSRYASDFLISSCSLILVAVSYVLKLNILGKMLSLCMANIYFFFSFSILFIFLFYNIFFFLYFYII